MSQLSIRVKLSIRLDCFMRLYKKRLKIIIWGNGSKLKMVCIALSYILFIFMCISANIYKGDFHASIQ